MNEWQKLVSEIAGELKCLPSVFADDNKHIVRKASEQIQRIEKLEKWLTEIIELDFEDFMSLDVDAYLDAFGLSQGR